MCYVVLFLGCTIPIMRCCIYIAWRHSVLCSQETRWKVRSGLCLHRWRSGHRHRPGKHKLRRTNTHALKRLTLNKSSLIQNLIHTVPESRTKVSVHRCRVKTWWMFLYNNHTLSSTHYWVTERFLSRSFGLFRCLVMGQWWCNVPYFCLCAWSKMRCFPEMQYIYFVVIQLKLSFVDLKNGYVCNVD